jgi:hypothetical protein
MMQSLKKKQGAALPMHISKVSVAPSDILLDWIQSPVLHCKWHHIQDHNLEEE